MIDRKQAARDIFNNGHNCAQSVLMTFHDLLGMSEKELMAVAAGFGGGMGKLQLTCGAATGAFMVFGIYASRQTGNNDRAKELSAGMIRDFEGRFTEKMGSLNCRVILGIDMNSEEGKRVASEKNLFGTICVKAVETATGIVEKMILT